MNASDVVPVTEDSDRVTTPELNWSSQHGFDAQNAALR